MEKQEKDRGGQGVPREDAGRSPSGSLSLGSPKTAEPGPTGTSRFHRAGRLLAMDENVLFWAFRYALGRRTYAVEDVAAWIVFQAEKLSPGTRELMDKEIAEAIENDRAGMEMDVHTWLRVRVALDTAKHKKKGHPSTHKPTAR